MGKNTDKKGWKSRVTYEVLEEVVRMKVQEWIREAPETCIDEWDNKDQEASGKKRR
jgi:hypothetical protein